jgi:hypothetical protein
MRVTFRRFPDHSSAYSVIERDDGAVFHLRGFTRSGPELPPDLRHLVVERELGVTDGLWGAIAAGIVYPSMRAGIMRSELLASLVAAIAVLSEPSAGQIEQLARVKLSAVPVAEPGAGPAAVVALPPPAALAAAARALQLEAVRWARLRPGEELGYEWRPEAPATGPVPGRALRVVPRQRDPADRRDPRHPRDRRPR